MDHLFLALGCRVCRLACLRTYLKWPGTIRPGKLTIACILVFLKRPYFILGGE